MGSPIKTIKDNLATPNAVNVFAFAFIWSLLWQRSINDIGVNIFSTILFVLTLVALHLHKSKLTREGLLITKSKPNISTWLCLIVWIIGAALQAICNEMIVAMTAQIAEYIIIIGLILFAINQKTERYLF